ncbi:tannase/feruloyl esterase family alpha/beta hydrolase [bacterium AH-315-P07]|nr:tannase/feruloyl esterase family alpha/beta hydrolase [bacterium AH-315-P07]
MKNYIALITLSFSLGLNVYADPRSGEALKNLQLPDVKIESIHHVDGDGAHYDVDGVIGGTIKFELLLPDDWNKRFAMGGGGGFVGSVQNGARSSVKRGFATVGTDTGHQGSDGSFAHNDALAQVNFGHVAIHRTAEVAKAIIRAHYGADPEYSYFLGCSRGGGQAMMEAQRYPEDFDGIVAGAPAFDWAGFATTGVNIVQAFYPDPAKLDKTILSRAEIKKLHDEAIDRFDEKDGIKDGIISDPASIEFDLDDVSWLNDAQRDAIRTIYQGPSNQNGQIHPGYAVGTEMEWFNWLIGPMPNQEFPALSFHFSVGLYKHFVFNDPDWDYSTYDIANYQEDWALAESTLSAIDPDLDTFKALGGKLILWHGWSDAALSAARTAQYFDALLERDANAHDYARLYLIPGCGHCGGGPGISQVDWLTTITDWVENDEAPNAVIAKKGRGTREKTRPLASYPAKTVYKGSGDPDKAESFVAH